jgi:hypothetical protein
MGKKCLDERLVPALEAHFWAAFRPPPDRRNLLGAAALLMNNIFERKMAMADDKSLRSPEDSSRIALGEDYEVQYWTNRFGVSRERLEEAVRAVGNSADAVERHLRG